MAELDSKFDKSKKKVHTIGKLASLIFRSARRSLSDALVPFEPPADSKTGRPIEAGREFGWTNVFDTPTEEEGYVVEFLGGRDVHIWAYVDGAGRCFAVDEPVDKPPYSEPEIEMATYQEEGESEEGHEKGYIFVRDGEGDQREFARYEELEDGYRVYDSWYQLNGEFDDLPYSDMMARLYCAAVIRPKLTGIEIPPRSFEELLNMLFDGNFAMNLHRVRNMLKNTEHDPMLKAPALAQMFINWLDEAGYDDKTSRSWMSGYSESDEGPLRLVHTEGQANTYYLVDVDESFKIPAQKVWAVESALNRLLLASEALGNDATLAPAATCAACDQLIREGIGMQAAAAEHPADEADETPTSEWDIRVKISQDMEKYRLPYRLKAEFRADIPGEGCISFLVTAPNADMMPATTFNLATGTWTATSQAEREAEALAYAERLGILLAASAFSTSRLIRRVTVKAVPLSDSKDGLVRDALYYVDFSREAFCGDSAYLKAAKTDPRPLFESAGMRLGDEAQFIDPFAVIRESATYIMRADAPEIHTPEITLTEDQQKALGARNLGDLRIVRNAEVVHAARQIHRALRESSSLQDSVRIVREVQGASENPQVIEGCTLILTELVNENIDVSDFEAVVDCLHGENVYEKALQEAQALTEVDPEKASEILRSAIALSEASGFMVDTSEVVYRYFDSYISRVLYNRMNLDQGRQVELLPPPLLACYLQLIELSNESFTQADNLVDYGMRLLELAPTLALAYRHCGRAHMLIGDLEGAAKRQKACLMSSLSPDNLAISYYQLGYVEWKAGRPLAGQACYCKSLSLSQICAEPAGLELLELMREEGLEMLPAENVDDVLAENDIPVAPIPRYLEVVKEAAIAATNAGIYPVAQALLASCLTFNPDDVLMNVLKSLAEAEAEE